jgi:hypothetical protein
VNGVNEAFSLICEVRGRTPKSSVGSRGKLPIDGHGNTRQRAEPQAIYGDCPGLLDS